MQIEGGCHCKNITYRLEWPGDGTGIAIRECGCAFCTKHAGAWTSHRDSELVAKILDESLLTKYRFGTKTADFYVCSRCGVVPFVLSKIGEDLYGVVNVNTFEGVDQSSFVRAAADFEGEDPESRLERRKRNWIQSVRISTPPA